MRRTNRFAFTLIEMLTVIAITAVLLTLIVAPVFYSFSFTRSAMAFADAQDKARILSERISREIGNSAAVRDVSGTDIVMVNGVNQAVPRHALAVMVPKVNADGTAMDTPTYAAVILPYAKVDAVLPAEGDPGDRKNGAYLNPDTGKYDPTLIAPKGPVTLPVAPGQTIVRWWIGRRDPFLPYNDPYTGLLVKRNSSRDNLFVLYRAEVPPTSDYFRISSAGTVIYDDPFFFEPDVAAPSGSTGLAKTQIVRNWLNRATIQTEVSRYDMIQAVYDKNSRKVANTNGIPQLIPLAQFRPERISNDPAAGATSLRLGEETDNPSAVGPEVFTTQFGQWSGAVVRVWPNGFSAKDSTKNEYEVGRRDSTGARSGFSIYGYDPDASGDELLTGTELFDVNAYEGVSGTSTGTALPFTAAVMAANTRSGWLDSARLREIFVPFDPNPSRGKLLMSFGIDEVGDALAGGGQNLPSIQTGEALSPTQDNGSGVPYAGTSASVNRTFNRVYSENPQLRAQLQRFIDLRVLPNEDGTLPPLYPNYTAGSATGFTVYNGVTRNSRVRVTAGSEDVVGPDQLDGPHHGQSIQYQRVTRNPGPNQYKINYVDQPEPTDENGNIDYSVVFPGITNPPADYDPTSLVSAVLQPRYRAGYIQLNSDPNSPIPDGKFVITYRFQFTGGRDQNGIGDRVAVDYDSRQLLSVLLTVRNYPQSNQPNPQSVTVKATATVRNYLR